jgi:membrane protease YdiL (CAAX protease family)
MQSAGTKAATADVELRPRWASAIAWGAILLASDLELIYWQFVGRERPPWSLPVRAVALALLAYAISRAWQSRQLQLFVFALAAMVGGDWVALSIQSYVTWFHTVSRDTRMLAGVVLTLIPAVLMSLTLFDKSLSARELFLSWGRMDANTSLPFARRLRWTTAAPLLLLLISGGLLTQLWIVSNASRHFRASVLLLAFPLAVVFAAINASCEEFRFRCLLLARGTRAVGVTHAIWATSVLFGLAHFGGHPSGFTGVLMAGFFAWVLARSMIDTGGWAWALLIHFVQDVIIFLMVAMTGV